MLGKFLKSGTKVRLDNGCASIGDKITSEYGVVVSCWLDKEINGYDCYVAFFGDEWPEAKPREIPYVLRYASVSLTVLDD